MIKIHIKPEFIQITGHAEYDVCGQDIVCSAVTTSIIMTLNLIEIFDLKNKIQYDLKEGFFLLKIVEENQELNKILDNLNYTLMNLSSQYPKNVKIYK